MGGARTTTTPSGGGTRGRIDKRQAILDAAFAVFAREGYAQAGVDTIAAEAGVAKATVYNHFHDKETLLRQPDQQARPARHAAGRCGRATRRVARRRQHLSSSLRGQPDDSP